MSSNATSTKATCGAGGFQTAQVLGLPVADVSKPELVELLAGLAQDPGHSVVAFALHIGGLSVADDFAYKEAMSDADIVYADGISAVALARIAGAVRIERSVTTDIGWDLLRRYRKITGRPARVAAIGGVGNASLRALRVLEGHGVATGVMATHGFHTQWRQVIEATNEQAPDIVLVGLGAPREMLWVAEHRSRLPTALILTCGGWFNYLTGEEARAPATMQKIGLEWLFRWSNQPRRLSARYLKGLFVLPVLVGRVAFQRLFTLPSAKAPQ